MWGMLLQRNAMKIKEASHRSRGLSKTLTPRLEGSASVKTSGHALESMRGLLQEPAHHARRVVAVRQVVTERREAVQLARFFHFV